MIIHIVRKYINLSTKKIVDPVICELNEDHGRLYTNLDENDKVIMYCLACDFKIKLGINSIQQMAKAVAIYENYY